MTCGNSGCGLETHKSCIELQTHIIYYMYIHVYICAQMLCITVCCRLCWTSSVVCGPLSSTCCCCRCPVSGGGREDREKGERERGSCAVNGRMFRKMRGVYMYLYMNMYMYIIATCTCT